MAPTVLQIGAAYIRVSTDDQTELSPDAQLRVIKEEATRDGFVIPPEYIFVEHKGISGRKASNRPEFQRMISIAKSQSPAPFKRLYSGSSHASPAIRKKAPFIKASSGRNAAWKSKVCQSQLWKVCSADLLRQSLNGLTNTTLTTCLVKLSAA